MEDVFIPEEQTAEERLEENPRIEAPIDNQQDRVNLADDPDLAEKVMSHLSYYYDKYQSERGELEDIWEAADWMIKCGQNETVRETERLRTDRQNDEMTKTKSTNVGSTLFFRQVRALAAQFVNVISSQKDPFRYKSRSNPMVFYSSGQADELANQHNMVMRWTRDQEDFEIKSIELIWELIKYSNIPVYSWWKRSTKDVLDRYPVVPSEDRGLLTKIKDFLTQNPETTDMPTVLERRPMLVDNRPVCDWISNWNFYADQNIGDIRKQNCVIVKSQASIIDFLAGERDEDYINVDKITDAHVWDGADDDSRGEREKNEGYSSETNSVNTGSFLQFDAHVLLPIDESKSKGKRWDDKKNIPKLYWVTVVDSFDTGVCLRIERNLDPDDEMPYEMISLYPGDKDKLYKMSLAQALRGNYTESTTAKAQAIDSKTLANNRPLKAIRGEVHVEEGGLKFGRDKVFWVDRAESLTEFRLAPVEDNLSILAYLDDDSDKTAGTVRSVRGEAMGGRTSAAEAENAFNSAGLPLKMIIKYVLHKWLKFYARKGLKQWHLYAREDQVLKITDEQGIYKDVRPIDLYGDFDVEVNIVDEFEQNMLMMNNLTYAAQNILPLFMDVMDKRELAKDVFDKFLHLDVSRMLLPDRADQDALIARQENEVMLEDGQYIAPTKDEDYDAHLREHEGRLIQYSGVEDTKPTLIILKRHIAETKFMRDARQRVSAAPSPTAPTDNKTDGQLAGNQIAARAGATQ